MELAAEVVEFRVPVGSEKTVFVWNISATVSEEEISHSLWKIFSEFGVLYSVRVCKNASVTEPGYYALVKFFSSRDALRAQQTCNKQRLFQESPLKVCLCTRQKEFRHEAQKLNSVKCQDLANHYLGFNGWSKRIIALQNISGLDEQENDDGMAQTQSYSVKYICVVEIVLRDHGLCSRGIAVAEELLENRKENGKVAVQYRPVQEAIGESLSDEDLQGLIQVNDLSWMPCNLDEDEEPFSEISLYEELEEGI
uniref:RAD52 motif-containing protein 1 n=1 Tax=Geotrypetes seraphini TaxID=260995 RepID=A0A6P8NH13_GEOSA|nr:RAD52 motif-containing protein 1 isoform X3 [Geotrypetes seraphini]